MFQLVHARSRGGQEDLLASGVVLTGGSTLLHGMPELAEEVLGLPVRRGLPRNIGGLTDVVKIRRRHRRGPLALRDQAGDGRPRIRRRLVFAARAIAGLGERAVLNRRVMDEFETDLGAKIKVIGVGGGGRERLEHDDPRPASPGWTSSPRIPIARPAEQPRAHKIQLGAQVTKGLGAGANPEIGRRPPSRTRRASCRAGGADMVFVTAGMGGGTGRARSGIADLARSVGALTVGVVTKPFLFEGKRRSSRRRAASPS